MNVEVVAGQFALATAAAFTGAAVYISVAEQSYAHGFAMQASLALASTLAGFLAFWMTRDWRWMLGALLIFANWPYTLIVILPVNKRLEATPTERANAETRDLIVRWGDLHAGRSALGLAAALAYFWAML